MRHLVDLSKRAVTGLNLPDNLLNIIDVKPTDNAFLATTTVFVQ